jgi:RNA polymerase sigma-70 factor (family 1)
MQHNAQFSCLYQIPATLCRLTCEEMIAGANIRYLQEQIARNNDPVAYKQLFTAFYNPLLHFAHSFLKSKEQAEEVVSDVFLQIWEKRKRIDSIGNLKVYLFISVKNTALNYLSRDSRHRTADLEQQGAELKSMYVDPEQLMVTAEMVSRIQLAIASLPPRCRLIFKLVKEDELKYREVAEILDLSVKTVEAQLAIALRKIAQSIQFDVRKSVLTTQAPHR